MEAKNKETGFEEVYPFATENIKGYFEQLDLKGKKILTVGSSLDQAFNALVLGAKKVTVLDINPNVRKFFELKKKLILEKDRKELYKIITNLQNSEEISISKDLTDEKTVYQINKYLENDELYQLLRKKLKETEVEFITGDIFNLDQVLGKEKYDRIILSNILQYLEYYEKDKIKALILLKNSFLNWNNYLNDQGIIQLLYLYSYSINDIKKENNPILIYNLRQIHNILKDFNLDIEWIDGICNNQQDAIVTYTKKTH